MPTTDPKRCPTLCDADCEDRCHEGHNVMWKKDHPDDWCQLTSAQRRIISDLTRALYDLGPTVNTASTATIVRG